MRTLREVAQRLGVSERTAGSWKADGMPTAGRDGYDLAAIRRWVAARGKGKPAEKRTEDDPRSKLEIEKLEEEVLAKRQKRLAAHGDLVPKSELLDVFEQFVIDARDALLAAPEQLALHCCDDCRPTAREEWSRRIRAILQDLAARAEAV